MKKIKVGQIGIGHNHGEAKMLAIRKFPELFEIIGYAEENEEWIKKRGNVKGYEGLTRYQVDELIQKCDALLIETDVWDLTETAKNVWMQESIFIWISLQAAHWKNTKAC